jgi:hypothetical protein
MDKHMGTKAGRDEISHDLKCDITRQVTEGILEEKGCTPESLAMALGTIRQTIIKWLDGQHVVQYRYWYRLGAVVCGFRHVHQDSPGRVGGRDDGFRMNHSYKRPHSRDRRAYEWVVPSHEEIDDIYEYQRMPDWNSGRDRMDDNIWWWQALGPRRYNKRKDRVRKEINKIRSHAQEIFVEIFNEAERKNEEKEKELNTEQ